EALSGPQSPRPSVLRVSLENAPSVEQVAAGAPDHNRARSAPTDPPPTELRHRHTEQQKPPQRAQAPPDTACDKAAPLTPRCQKSHTAQAGTQRVTETRRQRPPLPGASSPVPTPAPVATAPYPAPSPVIGGVLPARGGRHPGRAAAEGREGASSSRARRRAARSPTPSAIIRLRESTRAWTSSAGRSGAYAP